jgi:hypothetical protein
MSRRKRVRNPAKSTKFDQANEVRAIARERVGSVKPSQSILPKTTRKKPKHKKPLDQE